jgi:hypothetical protein
VDTLAAVHDSLNALVQQLDGSGQRSSADASSSTPEGETAKAVIDDGSRKSFSFEHGSLGRSPGKQVGESNDASGQEGDAAAEEAGEESSDRPSIDDLVAAARRAAQAAAEQHGTIGLGGLTVAYSEGRRRRWRSVLAYAAVILLLIGAAFLYVQFRPALEPLILAPAIERFLPSPAAQTPRSDVQGVPVRPSAAQPAELVPSIPVEPAKAGEAPEDLPWRTETFPAEDHPLAIGQAIFPNRE